MIFILLFLLEIMLSNLRHGSKHVVTVPTILHDNRIGYGASIIFEVLVLKSKPWFQTRCHHVRCVFELIDETNL